MRLFVAIPLPGDLRRRLAALAPGLPGTRPVSADNMHLTLRFIGEVDSPRAEAVDAALRGVGAPAFDLSFSELGCFAKGHRVHTLWLGVERTEALAHLRDKVESAVVRAGLPPEGRKFKPHVTIARFRNAASGRIGALLEDQGAFAAPCVPVERYILFRSFLGNAGPHYQELADYPLLTAHTKER